MIQTWWSRRRLRARVFLPFSALLVATLLATLWLVNSAVSRQAAAGLRTQVRVTGRVFEGLVRERGERLLTDVGLVAGDFALKRAMATFDPETLTSVAVNYRERLGLDLLWIADEKGVLLADAQERARAGFEVAGLAPLEAAIAGRPAAVVNELGGALYQLAAVPVLAPDAIGYLLAGLAIDDATAAQLRRETGSEVTFVSGGRVLASSWPAARRREVPSIGAQRVEAALAKGATSYLARVGGERFLSLLMPIESALPQPLLALVQQSYDAALEPLVRLRRRLALIGGAALGGALLVGAALAAGIAAPLQSLVGAMRDVLGGDFRRRLQVRREDEIGYLTSAFNEMVAGLEERERIKDVFGRYVSRDVAAAVLSRGDVGVDRREVTILFQDVRGFTSLAEHTDAAVLVGVVNRMFTRMVAAVEGQGGIIRQFTGDGVMALFGAPVQHPDDPVRAVRAAVEMVRGLPELNREMTAEGLPALRIGIGIHTGEVVAGQMGPDQRVEYSVVGDAVNLASRVEGLTKELQATILVTGETAVRLGAEFRLGRRAVLPVRGKERPVEVVEVLV